MIIIGKPVTEKLKEKHEDVRAAIDALVAEIQLANWTKPSDISQRYSSASFLADNHVILNIKGNKYRLMMQVTYNTQTVWIKEAGTHNEYNNW